ncbi:MAG TPA: hypothetical protein VLV32_00860 [Burkholderiales bacterium]|nr:hypothetical protein [Burkholderiales bacterium]
MFTNRNKLSALALGTLLSIAALQPALAANSTERADNDASKWFEQQLGSDGFPASAFEDRSSSYNQGTGMTVRQPVGIESNKWFEQQLASDGSPTPVFEDRSTSVYQGVSMTAPQGVDTNANTWLDRQLRSSDGNPDGQ